MGTPIFSNRKRPFHLGPFPMDRLKRVETADLSAVPPMQAIDFDHGETPASLVNAMGEYQAMLDAIRDGLINNEVASCPGDPDERARHIKSFGFFQDVPMEIGRAHV